MKNIQTIAILALMLFLAAACNPFDRSSRLFLHLPFPHNEQRVVIRSDNMSLDIRYSGDIVFNEDETAIEKISSGGYLDFTKDGKRLLAEAASGGDVVYKFYDDDNYLVGSGSGKKFLVEAIKEMIAQGLFIKGRMERLYQDGGVPLLLDEVKKTKSDYVKRQYLEYILQSDSVSKEEIVAVCNSIAKMMTSDDDKRRILEKISIEYLKDSVTSTAYFTAIESINSDNDKANALKKSLTEPLSEFSFKSLLKASITINSDNDKANLLKDLVRDDMFPGDSYDSLLGVVSSINSDNDKANVLKALINKQIYSGEQFGKLCNVIAKINSDNDKSNVFKKLAEQNITSDEDWISFINQTTSISSDNDKANVLLAVSTHMPRSEQVIAAYMKSSKTINSDHDYKRTVKPVL